MVVARNTATDRISRGRADAFGAIEWNPSSNARRLGAPLLTSASDLPRSSGEDNQRGTDGDDRGQYLTGFRQARWTSVALRGTGFIGIRGDWLAADTGDDRVAELSVVGFRR